MSNSIFNNYSKNKLIELNKKLAEELTYKGVPSSSDETLSELISKIGRINNVKNSSFTYTVKYLPNGGSGEMADSIHQYGVAKALTANSFSKSGYTFVGWWVSRKSDKTFLYTNDNMTTNVWYRPGEQPAGWRKSVYANKRSVSQLSDRNQDEVYLIAQWKPSATN